jgi:tetratricopeptide (TPR) repeat protein
VRQGLHARAFQVLVARGAGPGELVPHIVPAGLIGDAAAAEVLVAAGRDALAVGALAAAVEHLASAVKVDAVGIGPSLRLDMAGAQLAMGRVAEAEGTVREYLAGHRLSEGEQVAGLRLLGQVMLASAGNSEARRCAEEASGIAVRFAPELAAEILLDATFFGWLFEGPRAARFTTGRVLEMLQRSSTVGSALAEAARTADAYLALIGGDPSGIAGLVAAARSELDRPGGPRHMQPAWSWDVVFAYVNLSKVVECFEDVAVGYDAMAGAALQRGASLTYHTYTINHADTLWRIGRLEEAYALLGTALEVAELAPILAPFASVGMAHLCFELGADHDCAHWVERVEAAMPAMADPAYLRLWLSMISCGRHLSSGRLDAAAAAADKAAEVARSSGIVEPCVVPWHGPAIEAYVSTGDLARAAEIASLLDTLCAPLPCRAPRAVAAAGHAAVAWRRGLNAQADAHYEEALEHNAAVPMPLAEAETLIAYGQFLRHTGNVAKARKMLHRAVELLAPTGARRLQRIQDSWHREAKTLVDLGGNPLFGGRCMR